MCRLLLLLVLTLLLQEGLSAAAAAEEEEEEEARPIDEMLQYAKDTNHSKIKRALAVGIALVAYGAEERADTLIAQLTGDAEPIIRYGADEAAALAALAALAAPAAPAAPAPAPAAAALAAAPAACTDTSRTGGMLAIGMAYAGTSSNEAMRKLLHVAVSPA